MIPREEHDMIYYCPCCGTKLLRLVSKNRLYWFCRSCYQEMPILNEKLVGRKTVLPLNQVSPSHWSLLPENHHDPYSNQQKVS